MVMHTIKWEFSWINDLILVEKEGTPIESVIMESVTLIMSYLSN